MAIRKMNVSDIEACAAILCKVYNNELWMCRWEMPVAIEYLTDFFKSDNIQEHHLAGITLSTNKYAPAPKFYKKNGFINCEHVIFMAKELS